MLEKLKLTHLGIVLGPNILKYIESPLVKVNNHLTLNELLACLVLEYHSRNDICSSL